VLNRSAASLKSVERCCPISCEERQARRATSEFYRRRSSFPLNAAFHGAIRGLEESRQNQISFRENGVSGINPANENPCDRIRRT
jgi:hypothetical protein